MEHSVERDELQSEYLDFLQRAGMQSFLLCGEVERPLRFIQSADSNIHLTRVRASKAELEALVALPKSAGTAMEHCGDMSMNIRAEIVEQFARVAEEHGKRVPSLTDDTPLMDSGLDSLCFAIIVTRLEDAIGVDPFNAESTLFPVTFGEFVNLYENAAKQAGDTNAVNASH